MSSYCLCYDEVKECLSKPLCTTYGGIFDRRVKFKSGMQIDAALVGLNPWFGDWANEGKDLYCRAFGDKSEKILSKYMDGRIDMTKIFVTNVLRCSVKNNEAELMYKAFEVCKHNIAKELAIVKPKHIVALGNKAYDMLRSIKIQPIKILHPNAVSYNPLLKQRFEADIDCLSKIIRNAK